MSFTKTTKKEYRQVCESIRNLSGDEKLKKENIEILGFCQAIRK